MFIDINYLWAIGIDYALDVAFIALLACNWYTRYDDSLYVALWRERVMLVSVVSIFMYVMDCAGIYLNHRVTVCTAGMLSD